MIGKLNERVTFQAYTLADDGIGGKVKTWGNLASVPTVWAHVIPKSGTETRSEDRDTATGVYVFVIRERSDIDERTRIVWRGENYNIRHVMRRGNAPQYLDVQAERGV